MLWKKKNLEDTIKILKYKCPKNIRRYRLRRLIRQLHENSVLLNLFVFNVYLFVCLFIFGHSDGSPGIDHDGR